MAAIHNTSTFYQSSTKVTTKIYAKTAVKVKPAFQDLFNVVGNDKNRSFMTYQPIVGFGTFKLKPEGAVPALDQAFEGTPTSFNFVSYYLSYKVTDDASMEDAKNLLRKLPGFLAYSEQVSKDLLIWNVLNVGFTVNGTDGVPLFSASHPLAGTPGVTISNYAGLVALSPESIAAALINFQTMVDDRNLPQYRTPKKLVVPPALWKTAEEVTGAKYYPYSNENRPNVVAGALDPMVVRYLTSNTAWFVTAGKSNDDMETDSHSLLVSFKYQNKTKSWVDPATDNFNQKAGFRLTFGWGDFRGVYGSQGA